MFSWDKIEQLLNITNLARQWPNLKHIHDSALKELQEMQERKQELKTTRVEVPDPPKEVDASDEAIRRRNLNG